MKREYIRLPHSSLKIIIKIVILVVVFILIPTCIFLAAVHQVAAKVDSLIVFKTLVTRLDHIFREHLFHILLVSLQLEVRHFI